MIASVLTTINRLKFAFSPLTGRIFYDATEPRFVSPGSYWAPPGRLFLRSINGAWVEIKGGARHPDLTPIRDAIAEGRDTFPMKASVFTRLAEVWP